MRRRTPALVWLVALVAAGVWGPERAEAQPRFGFEVEVGRNVGLTPYLANIVYSEAEVLGRGYTGGENFRPYLADERSGWGSGLGARIVTDGFKAGAKVRWYSVDTAVIHHRGDLDGRPDDQLRASRVRPNGTVDDAGVDYRPLREPLTLDLGPVNRSTLVVIGLGGGYRIPVLDKPFRLFVPVGGQLRVTFVTRRPAPLRPGLGLQSGIGAAFDVVESVGLVVKAGVDGLATPAYWNRTDQARRVDQLDGTTEGALFSTQLAATFDLAFQFEIR